VHDAIRREIVPTNIYIIHKLISLTARLIDSTYMIIIGIHVHGIKKRRKI